MSCGDEGEESAYVGSFVAQGRAIAVGSARGAQLCERDGGVGGVDPSGVGEVAQAEAGPAGQRVLSGQGDGQRLLRDGHRVSGPTSRRWSGSLGAAMPVDQADVQGCGGDLRVMASRLTTRTVTSQRGCLWRISASVG